MQTGNSTHERTPLYPGSGPMRGSPMPFAYIVRRTAIIGLLAAIGLAAPALVAATSVTLQNPTATFSQDSPAGCCPVSATIDAVTSTNNGWAIARGPDVLLPTATTAEAAAWETASDLGPGTLSFTMLFDNAAGGQHPLAAFASPLPQRIGPRLPTASIAAETSTPIGSSSRAPASALQGRLGSASRYSATTAFSWSGSPSPTRSDYLGRRVRDTAVRYHRVPD